MKLGLLIALLLIARMAQTQTLKPPAALAGKTARAALETVSALAAGRAEAQENNGPGKYDIKPYDPAKMKFDIATADEEGNAIYLPKEQEQNVRDIINRMAPEQVPQGGMIFVPEKKYKEIQAEVNRGYLFGRKISTGNEENFQLGGDALGDGFSLPQYRVTYMNAALLKDQKKLEYVLGHELGHNAAWLSDPKHADLSERGADAFKDAYIKRANDTQKNWNAIKNLADGHR